MIIYFCAGLIPLALIVWLLGPKRIIACFKAVAGWIGTIPALVASIHLWGNDTVFQKLVKGIISGVCSLLSWVTGYRKGYEKGYQDAMAQRKRRWWRGLWPFGEKD